MNRSRLAALSAGAMFLVASVFAPAVATADTGGTNTLKVLPATTTISPVGTGGSFTVTIAGNGSVPISGVGAGLTFDNTKLTLTAIARDAALSTEASSCFCITFAGFPAAGAATTTFIANANSSGSIPVLGFSYNDGVSSKGANTDVTVWSATFTVAAVGDSTLTPFEGLTGGILDGQAASYGAGLSPITPVNGTVVNHLAPVFTISAPASASVDRGSFTDVTVNLGVSSGTPGTINLSTSGLPAGVTTGFTPNPAAAPPSTSTLRFTASGAAATGTSTVTITGVDSADPTDTRSTTIQLTVVAPNDFALSASPSTVTVTAGGAPGSTSVSVTQLTPTVGTVNLSITSAPIAGVTASLVAGSATVGTPDTLNISTTAAAAPGSYTITVSGTNTLASPSNTHTTNVTLIVNGAAAPNQQDVSVSGTMDAGFIGLTCPTSLSIPLLRGNTNQLNVPCAVYTNTAWALNVNDPATDASKGYMVTGRPVDNVTKFQMPDSMHVLADAFISGGDVFYRNDVNLVAGGTILTGTNSANAPVVLSQFVRASTQPGTYSIQLLFSALSTF